MYTRTSLPAVECPLFLVPPEGQAAVRAEIEKFHVDLLYALAA